VLARVERANSLFSILEIAGDGPDEAVGRVAQLTPARRALARLVDQPAERRRRAVRLVLQPFPMAWQERYLPAPDAQPRPPWARRGGGSIGAGTRQHLVQRAAEVDVDLLARIVVEDEHRLSAGVEMPLRRGENRGPIPGCDFGVAGEDGEGRGRFHWF